MSSTTEPPPTGMPPAAPARGRNLECSKCAARYRSSYRGRRPLCQSCRANETNEKMSPQSTSLSELPTDVLCNLLPYLLMGRFDLRQPDSYCWAQPVAVLRLRGFVALHFCRKWIESFRNVIECAWLPTIRIKLVCKALYKAVNLHMDRLTLPRDACMRAATTIQNAFFHLRVMRSTRERDHEMNDEWHDIFM